MKLEGKEYKLFYSVGAHIAFDNWVVANPKASFVDGIVQKFIIMINAYNMAHGEKQTPPKKEELMNLPNRVLEDIYKAVDEQEKIDTAVTVEAEPVKKGKNAKSPTS